MAVCLPCNHEVDETTVPSWDYKGVTFYFCGPGCEEQVKADPEKWIEVAQSGQLRGDAPHHGHHHGH